MGKKTAHKLKGPVSGERQNTLFHKRLMGGKGKEREGDARVHQKE